MPNAYAKNTKTGRLIKKSTALYKKLKKLNMVEEIDELVPIIEKQEIPEAIEQKIEPEKFDESKLQKELASISTDMIKKNLKTIVKSQKLSDDEFDTMLKKMLYKRLCIEPKTKSKPKKKSKKHIVESSESDSE